MIETVKGFWEDVVNRNIYVIESDTFGKVIAGAGPFKPDNLLDLENYNCGTDILEWLEAALKQKKLRRFNPPEK